jgi:hypothetical protein
MKLSSSGKGVPSPYRYMHREYIRRRRRGRFSDRR